MAKISSETIFSLELSYNEYKIILNSLAKTATTQEEINLYETIFESVPGNEIFNSIAFDGDEPDGSVEECCEVPELPVEDIRTGDSVILLHESPDLTGLGYAQGDVFEVRDTYGDQLLITKRGGKFGIFAPKEYFVLEQPAPKFDDVDDAFKDQFSNLLDRFSR